MESSSLTQSKVEFLISPHPKAPLFNSKDAQLILVQALSEVTSQNFQLTAEVLQVLRQAGYVNLFFLVKYIWGVDGEYDRLTEELHLPLCNFVQSIVTTPGGRGFVVMPRGHGKSKGGTEGGSGFTLLRDPTKALMIMHAKESMADNFREAVRNNFQGDFFQLLYPEYSVTKRGDMIVLVNGKRPKFRREPSIYAGGALAALEGGHYDGLFPDDIYGASMTNAMRQSGTDMEKTRQRFATNSVALLNGPAKSFILMSGTRWGTDDGYRDQFENMKESCADVIPGNYVEKKKGIWRIYYKDLYTEENEPIFPEEFPKEMLDQLAIDDPWTYMVQFRNNPYAAGIAEFIDSQIKRFELRWDEKLGWLAVYFNNGVEVVTALSKGHTVAASDPAASEVAMSAKTSRTALLNMTRMSNENKFIFGVKAGFVPIGAVGKVEEDVEIDRTKPSLYNWMFDNAVKYHMILSKTVLETQGAFKVLGPLIRAEQVLRQRKALKDRVPFYGPKLTPVNRVVTDKNAVIRSYLQPELDAGRIYVEEGVWHIVAEEVRGFPTSSKKDVLDAICLAIIGSYRPQTEEEEAEVSKEEDGFAKRYANQCGM